MKIALQIKQLIRYLANDIWLDQAHYANKRLRWLISQVKVFKLAIENYGRHQILVRSAALSFFSVMSLVPIMAMVFAVSKGFGIEDKLVAYIAEELSSYKVVFDQIAIFANSLLENQKIGLFAGISVFVFVWALLMVFGNIENAFNYIWDIKKQRSISRKISYYLAIVFILPPLFVLYSSISAHIESQLTIWATQLTVGSFILEALLNLSKMVIVWLIFILIYTIFPNTRVKIIPAAISAVLTGTLYMVFEELYIYFQHTVTTYNVIYGSFAALPLMLIWMNISWQIVLFGAELSFAYQNIGKYEYERATADVSISYRRKLSLLVMQSVIKRFLQRESPLTDEQIAHQLDMPVSAVRDVLFELERVDMLISVEKPQTRNYIFIPTRDVSVLTIWDVVEALDKAGRNSLGSEGESYKQLDGLLVKINDSAHEAKENILLKDCVDGNFVEV